MNYKIKLYIEEINTIYRIINVNDNIPIQLFIKTLIISMNGDSKVLHNLYKVQKNTEKLIEYGDDKLLSDLNLKVDETYQISYEDKKMWVLSFKILETNNNLEIPSIAVIGLHGYGICQNEDASIIKKLMTTKDSKWKDGYLKYSKKVRDYLYSTITVEDINKKICDYLNFYENAYTPKTVILNVSLEGYTKEIKRSVSINSNIIIDKFCRCVVASMNGDLEHLYTIKLGKNMYDEDILDKKISFLELTKGQRFKVIYDYGDNWEFNVRVVKTINDYQEKEFIIESGRGYGIIEDCGGIYGLYNVFNGTSEYFDKVNIDEFDLEALQEKIDKEL